MSPIVETHGIISNNMPQLYLSPIFSLSRFTCDNLTTTGPRLTLKITLVISVLSNVPHVPSWKLFPASSFPNMPQGRINTQRKRADAELNVLNEVHTRTAFPSKEERAALEKMLDIIARSVQVW